jgi:glycosyltransferase involved in cell wall biosynthesis
MSVRKKVAMISETSPLDPGYRSGVGVVTAECIEALKIAGWRHTLVAAGFPGCDSDDVDGVHAPSVRIPIAAYRAALTFMPSVERNLREIFAEADIVHIHSLNPLSRKALKILESMGGDRPKSLLHLHTQYDEYAYTKLKSVGCGNLAKRIANRLTANYCRMADQVVTTTSFHSDLLMKNGSLTKQPLVWSAPISIPPIIPTLSRCQLSQMGSATIPTSGIVLYFSGRIQSEKNIETLLDVMDSAVKSGQDVSLVLAGGGRISQYQRILPPHLRNRVNFLGSVPRYMVFAVAKICDIGITLSTTESQGLALLEQMAMGLPVIVPAGTTFDKPVGESMGGFLVSLDVKDVCSAIQCLSQNYPERLRMGLRAGAYIQENYSPAVQYRKLIEIYEEMLA